MQHYNESQVKDIISAVGIYNSDDERDSCIENLAITELQDAELSLTDEVNSTVVGQHDLNISDPQDSSISSNCHDLQTTTKEVTSLNSQLNKVKEILKIEF